MQTRQRRRFERASARFPVWVRRAETGTCLQGHSANVSAGGMYLLTAVDSEFALGTEVTVQFGIRDDEHGGFVMHEATKGAEIVRMERHGYGMGIAVKFAAPEFSRFEPEPRLA